MPKKSRRGRNEGSFTQLPNGTWEGRVSLGKDADGKRVRRKVYGPTKADVQAQVRELLAAAGRTSEAPPEDTRTVGEWLGEWLAGIKGEVEPNTHAWYERRARRHVKPRIGHVRLTRLTPLDVRAMLAALEQAGVSAGERRNAMTTLRRALNVAADLGLVRDNVARRVAKPKKVRRGDEVVALTLDQARAFLAAALDHPLYALFALALDTGMRPGEWFGLHWPEVDTAARTVKVARSLEEISGALRLKPPKSARGRRTLPVTEHTAAALATHRERMAAAGRDVVAGPVFVNARGGLLRQSNFHRDVWDGLAEKAGLPAKATPYSLRHTAATQMLMAGVSLKVVSERLGHEDVTTTLKHYAHVLPGMQEQAVAAAGRLFFAGEQQGHLGPPAPIQEGDNSTQSQ